jgi:magnesium transporter
MTAKNMGRAIGLMSTQYRTIHYGCTVAQALEVFRDEKEKGKGSYMFVLNAQDSLIGFISLSSLLRIYPGEVITEFMMKEMVAVREADTQEKIARLIFKYKLEAIPVVDEQGKILGMVTVWKALDYLLPQSWKKKIVDNENPR